MTMPPNAIRRSAVCDCKQGASLPLTTQSHIKTFAALVERGIVPPKGEAAASLLGTGTPAAESANTGEGAWKNDGINTWTSSSPSGGESEVNVLWKARRESGTATQVTHLVGDVAGKPCLIVDDMISTGSTLASGIEALLKADARPELTIAATHGLLLPGASQKLAHEAVKKVFITNTVAEASKLWPCLQVISIAPIIAEALKRLLEHRSLGVLY